MFQAYILMYNRLKENQEYILHPMLSQIEMIRTNSAEKNLIGDINIQIAQTTEQVLSINRLKAKGLIEPVSYIEAIQVRKELTDEWQDRGVQKGIEFAILTDEITKAWSGMSTRQYKNLKGLKKENLRDNMSTTEIILNMLAETATKDLSRKTQPKTFEANRNVAKRGGTIAGNARRELEQELGESVITSKNAAQLNEVVTNMIEGVVSAEEDDIEN